MGFRFAVRSALFSFPFFLGFLTSGGQNPPAKVPVPPAGVTQQSPNPTQTPQTGSTNSGQQNPISSGNATQSSNAGQGSVGTPLSLEDAVRLASAQVSAYQQAGINERIVAEDVKQAHTAFLPKISAPLSYIYTSPLLGAPPGTPRIQSFIANNGIGEYQAFVTLAGDVDINGKLRASLRRNQALLEAARAGTMVARRTLAELTTESYYGLALATARLQSAETSLAAAEEFEKITVLLHNGGEVAQVDVTRAQLQVSQRQDDLDKARSDASIAADALRVLVGYDFNRPISSEALSVQLPVSGEIERITSDTITRRPEFAQLDAERRAAEQEIRIARADRRPSLSYSINGGFDTDSVRPPRFKEHTGYSAQISLNIPIFDFGASQSRELQARLRAELAESQRTLQIRTFYQQFYSARTFALSAYSRIGIATTGLRQAESNLSASIARYRAGEAPILEVTDAQTSLAMQRLALYQAIFDYETALARLLQAAGQ
jgi:outer membrane protein